MRNPQSAMLAAGGYMTMLAVILLLWAGCGVLGLAIGMPALQVDAQAMVELICVVGGVSLPMLYCGLRTLSGRLHALVLGMLLLLLGIIWVLGVLPDFGTAELASRLQEEGFLRFQLMSILSLLFVFGLITHSAALANRFRRE